MGDEHDPGAPVRPSRAVRHRFALIAALVLIVIVAGVLARSVGVGRGSAPTTEHAAATQATRSAFADGGACVRLGAHPQPPYANIQVTHDAALGHSESMVVEDPQNPLHLVGGAKYFTNLQHYRFQVGYAVSFDGGCTWSDGGFLRGFAPDLLTSDPTFAFGPDGSVYAAVLFAPADNAPSARNGIAVLRSTDGGRTFGAPVTVYSSADNVAFNDKPWMVVDDTTGPHSGSIYVAWSYDHNVCPQAGYCAQDIAFARSTDHGATFSQPVFIEGSAPFCTNPAPGRPANSLRCDLGLGAVPAILPDGTIAVAYAYEHLAIVNSLTRLLVVVSHDGGAHWSAPVSVADVRDIAGRFPPARFRAVTIPALAVDPRTGQLYLAWSQKDDGAANVYLSTSRDGGSVWSTPVRANDDPPQPGVNHFQPQVAVAPDGVVSVTFFDTRNHPRTEHVDLYLAQSVNHGLSFLPNMRVTLHAFDPAVGAPTDEYGNQFIGDYQGLAVDDTFVHPLWNDSRTGAQQLFTAAIPSAHPSAVSG